MKTERQNVGRRGEDLACRYLENLGHRVVARNWRCSHLEIDIITLEAGTLHFVEVKSRTAPLLAEPQANVNYRKKCRIARAAEAFLHSDVCRNLPPAPEVSLDVVTVVFYSERFSINFIPNAYLPVMGGFL